MNDQAHSALRNSHSTWNPVMQIYGVLETCLYVNDLMAAVEFYTTVLGMRLIEHQPGRHAFFRCANQMLLLFDPRETNRPDTEFPQHGALGAGHVAFAVDENDWAAWKSRLQQFGVAIEKTIVWPQGGASIYFRDPAGNSLELALPTIWHLPVSRSLTDFETAATWKNAPSLVKNLISSSSMNQMACISVAKNLRPQ
jgi:catechol 2,3-dioxygenase-like lactoylglutathione lyase family enzyme